jgi:hypothetical protein
MKIKLRKAEDGDGYDCLVSVGEISIGATSDDKASALHAAAGLAHDLTTAMQNNPELAVLLPPQTVAALKAIRIASWAAKHGRLPEAAKALGTTAVNTVKGILRSVF